MLRLDHITISIDGCHIVSGISLEAAPGEIVAVIGPNGSGKSTLMRGMVGIVKPSSGTIQIDGRDLQQLHQNERARQIAYLPQSMSYGSGYTVGEFVMLAHYPWRDIEPLSTTKQRLQEMLGLCHIASLAEREVSTLSGGELQRVYLAQTLFQNTPIILLDEPSSFQDLHNVIVIEQILTHLKNAGKTVICITHDFQTVNKVCQSVLALKQGHTAYCGAPGDVLSVTNLATLFDIDEALLQERLYHPQLMLSSLGDMPS